MIKTVKTSDLIDQSDTTYIDILLEQLLNLADKQYRIQLKDRPKSKNADTCEEKKLAATFRKS